MKLIKPSQISGEIMTLIQEADSKLVIVSPYYNFDKWKKLLNAIKFPIDKKIDIEFYVREGEFQSINQIKNLDFEPIEIKRLHTKLYFNENYAIVSSMNLLESSDKESLDIAYMTETKEEYKDLIDYYKRYIKNNTSKTKIPKPLKSPIKHSVIQGDWVSNVECILNENRGRGFYTKFKNSSLNFNGPNNYSAYISNEFGKNTLNIYGIISNMESSELLEVPSKIYMNDHLKEKYKTNGDFSLDYNSICYHSNINLKSSDIQYLYKEDYDTVIDIITDFIIGLQNFKHEMYLNRKSIAKNTR